MKHFRKLVGPYCFWLFVLTVLPMFLIMIYAFIQKGNAITTFSFTLDNFSKFFDPIFVSVLIKSFVLGIITTILCLAIGYPVAYAISKPLMTTNCRTISPACSSAKAEVPSVLVS